MKKAVRYFAVAVLLAASPAEAARIDVLDTSGFGALFASASSTFSGGFALDVDSNVFFDGTTYTYVYELSNYNDPGPPSPVGLFNVAGEWGVGLGNWGGIATGTIGAVALVGDPTFSSSAMVGLLGNANAPGSAWPAGGLNVGETLLFYVQSFKAPHLNAASAIDSGLATGVALAPTPEPGTLALIGAGLVGLYGIVRRRQQRQADV